MDQAKIHCGKCKDCTPKRQKEVQGETWEPIGKTPGYGDRTNLRSKDGKTRSCPTWAVTDPHPIRHEEPEEEEPEEEEDDGSWIVDEGYGPHCESCGASRGEDHCATCPNHRFGQVPTAS
jgi:hypothetical protein